MYKRESMDVKGYIKKTTNSGVCFICEMIKGNPDYYHHIVFEDDLVIAFLNKFPTLYGYTLLATKEHLEHVTADFTLKKYLSIQKRIYFIAEALRELVGRFTVFNFIVKS